MFSWHLIPATRRCGWRIFMTCEELMVLAESDEAGVFLCMTLGRYARSLSWDIRNMTG